MPVYLQIIIIFVCIVIFYFFAMFLSGLGVRRLCFKIIADMEEANAYNAANAVDLPPEKRSLLKLGARNLRPQALNVLIAEGLVEKTVAGKYFLNREKVASLKERLT